MQRELILRVNKYVSAYLHIAVLKRGEVCPMPYAHGGLCPRRPMPYARRNMLLRKAIVRLEERTNNLYILAGEAIEIEIYPNRQWRYSDEPT